MTRSRSDSWIASSPPGITPHEYTILLLFYFINVTVILGTVSGLVLQLGTKVQVLRCQFFFSSAYEKRIWRKFRIEVFVCGGNSSEEREIFVFAKNVFHFCIFISEEWTLSKIEIVSRRMCCIG